MAAASSASLVESSLEEVRRVVLGGLSGVRAKVWLFGSRATGCARDASDIDVAVLPLEPLPAGLLAGIRDALEESTVPWRVDLVDLSEASGPLKATVESEGVPWSD